MGYKLNILQAWSIKKNKNKKNKQKNTNANTSPSFVAQLLNREGSVYQEEGGATRWKDPRSMTDQMEQSLSSKVNPCCPNM